MNKKLAGFEVFRQADKQAAAAELGEYLNRLLAENKQRPVLLMLSGGSALKTLDYLGKTSLGENLTISMLDERFSQDPEINNFARMQKTDFYQDALNAGCGFFGTLPRNGETMESLAERWEKNLKKWREANPQGLIAATLGMGAEGHTAGIFPHPGEPERFKSLFCGENWIAAYNVIDKHQFSERLTATLTFLKLIDVGLAFVCGSEKQERLDAVLKHYGEAFQLPALGWYEIKKTTIFSDIN